MRWRVTYDLSTSMMQQYGRHIEVEGVDDAHAAANAVTEVFARQHHILDARHDAPGTGLSCTVTRVEPIPAEARQKGTPT